MLRDRVVKRAGFEAVDVLGIYVHDSDAVDPLLLEEQCCFVDAVVCMDTTDERASRHGRDVSFEIRGAPAAMVVKVLLKIVSACSIDMELCTV